jgi:zinc transport system substrate-binding protein
MSRYRSFLISFGILSLFFFSLPTLATGTNEKIKVFVSIVPQIYFVEKIGGKYVEPVPMVHPGDNPHNYEPKAQQMAELSRAKAYFAIGVPFENAWLPKLTAVNPKMAMIHTETNIVKLPMADHAPNDGKHTDEALDPHIWLSPRLVKIQAGHILQGLIAMLPQHTDEFKQNHKNFIAELENLDRDLTELFKQTPGKRIMVFHPTWGYFARDYGLIQIPIEVEGKEPKAAQVWKLIAEAKKQKIDVIFAQPEFSAKSAQFIADEIDAKLIFAGALDENWEKNLRTIAAQFKAALR